MGELVHLKREPDGPTRTKLSKSQIDALTFDPHGGSWQVVWDTEVENLGVRLGARSKSWILRYRNAAGKRRCWTIGSTAKIPVKKARTLAEQGNARITMGEDPSMQKQTARAAGKASTEFTELARSFIDDYAKANRKTWETDERRLLPGSPSAAMKALHRIDLAQATVEAVEAAVKDVHRASAADTPVEANRVAQTVNRVLNWHVKERRIPRQFHNILEFVELEKEGRRTDYLRPGELAEFAKAVRPLPLKWKGAIWLALLTGSRLRSEVLQLRWTDVQLHVEEFTFTETKNGTSHTLPMTPKTRAIFDALPRTADFLFPSRAAGRPVQDSRKTFAIMRGAKKGQQKTGKFADFITPHALRHTAKTYLEAKLHVSKSVANAVLNHADEGMSATYTHVDIDDVKAALLELERFVFDLAEIDDWDAYLTRRK